MSVLLIFYLGLNLDLITQEHVPKNNSIMQIIMECLIGWNFKLKKQTSIEFSEKFLAGVALLRNSKRFTLHLHILLFIANV